VKNDSVTVAIGLGGNLGDPAENISSALAMIEEKGLGSVEKRSSNYRTEPVGIKDQPWFVNAAALVKTELNPEEFHKGLKEIEREMGRPDKRVKDGPRLIDLDILLWQDEIIDTNDLVVPHPRMHQRRFVLDPLAEIAPGLLHPKLNKSISELLQELEDPAAVEKS